MANEKAQGLLAKIKQLFNQVENPQQFATYKLKDGTEISVDKLEAGGVAKVGDAFLPVGEHVIETGETLVVGENGVITEVKAVAAPPDEVDMTTPEGMKKAYDKFAVGTPEERIANAETLLKALMEYSFGWQLREVQEKANREAAMKVYTDTLKATESTVATQSALMKQMFELMTELAGMPAGDPPPPTKRKFSFGSNDAEGKVKSMEKFVAAAEIMRKELEEKNKTAVV